VAAGPICALTSVPCARFGSQRGFTLLELLMVIVIMSAVAWVSLGMMSTSTDQVRFEDTRNRLQAIRRAIIGDTSRTVNGGPELRGYVADMGILPENLNALLAREYCNGKPDRTSQAACTTAGGTWVTQPAYAYNADYGLWSGWNGPYLPATELSGYPRFQDGWGRPPQSDSPEIPNNFGWIYSHTAEDPKEWNAGYLFVQSYGRDGALGGDDFDADYPATGQPLLRNSEWRVLVTDSGPATAGDGSGGLKVDFGSPASGTKALCMAVAYPSWGGGTAMTIKKISGGDAATGDAVTLTGDGTQRILTFVFEDSSDPSYDEDTWLPLGQAAYGVFEHSGSCKTMDPEAATVFPATAARWTVFSVVPGAVLQPFERKVN
jgi:prepilin-type N-terminal cleavage/methylation domain-containing protein